MFVCINFRQFWLFRDTEPRLNAKIYIPKYITLKPNTHCRRDATVELSRIGGVNIATSSRQLPTQQLRGVGVRVVYWALYWVCPVLYPAVLAPLSLQIWGLNSLRVSHFFIFFPFIAIGWTVLCAPSVQVKILNLWHLEKFSSLFNESNTKQGHNRW